MPAEVAELLQKRNEAINEARRLIDRAEKEKRAMSQHENGQYDAIIKRVEALDLQALDARKKSDLDKLEVRHVAAKDMEKIKHPTNEDWKKSIHRAAIGKWMKSQAGHRVALSDVETRTVQADLDVSGGFLKAPQQMVNEIIQAVDDMLFVRELGRNFQLQNSESLGAPSLDTDPDDAEWTAEIASATEDTNMAFGKRELKPRDLVKFLKVSKPLLRVTNFDVISFINQRIAYKIALPQEKAFLTGNGVNKPLGVFTASNDGVSTSRDFGGSDNSTTAITFDGLKEVKGSLKAQYLRNSRWLFHRDAITQISKLKDGNGQYLWQSATRMDEPDMLLGRPVDVSEFAPNTFTTGQYVGILADWQNYWIANGMEMELEVLRELFAQSNEIGIIARAAIDGMPVLEEAFSRVTLA